MLVRNEAIACSLLDIFVDKLFKGSTIVFFRCHISTSMLELFLILRYFVETSWGFPGGAVVKNPPASAGDVGSIPGPEDPLEEDMPIHSIMLAWKIPWMGSLAGYSPWDRRIGQDWVAEHTETWASCHIPNMKRYISSFPSHVLWGVADWRKWILRKLDQELCYFLDNCLLTCIIEAELEIIQGKRKRRAENKVKAELLLK